LKAGVKLYPPPAENLAGDLDKYARLALDMDASEAEIVRAEDIPLDIRAYYAQCVFPCCRWTNTS